MVTTRARTHDCLAQPRAPQQPTQRSATQRNATQRSAAPYHRRALFPHARRSQGTNVEPTDPARWPFDRAIQPITRAHCALEPHCVDSICICTCSGAAAAATARAGGPTLLISYRAKNGPPESGSALLPAALLRLRGGAGGGRPTAAAAPGDRSCSPHPPFDPSARVVRRASCSTTEAEAEAGARMAPLQSRREL